MKNARQKLVMALVLASLGVTVSARAAEATFGAAKLPDAELTLPAMLVFAIQDEYLARAEYQQVIEKFGADLELANIAMYERFLKKELPADVRSVFEHLLTGSRNHLAALQRDGRGR